MQSNAIKLIKDYIPFSSEKLSYAKIIKIIYILYEHVSSTNIYNIHYKR